MKNLNYSTFFNGYLSIFAAVFCVSPKLTVLLIMGMIPLMIVGMSKKQLAFKLYRTNLLLVTLFVMYLIGIFFTDHIEIAKGYAENKLSFLVFPILFSFKPKFILKIHPIVIGLVIGLVAATSIGLTNAISLLNSGGGLVASFTSVNISPIHHPTYFSTFVIVTLVGVWWLYKNNEPYFKLNWIVPFSLFSLAIILLCLSMSAILFFILFVGILLLNRIYHKINRWVFYGILTLCPILISLFLSYAPLLKEDFHYTKNAVANYFKAPSEFIQKKTGYTTGNEVRLIMWTVTTLEIIDHPFGVGTGNIDDHLSERLTAFGQTKLAQKDEKETIRFNPHNQFLQTSLEIGVLGGLVLLVYLISAFLLAYKFRNVFFMVVVGSLVFNALFESMLQRQSGIVFYSFLITLLVVIVQQSSSQKTSPQER